MHSFSVCVALDGEIAGEWVTAAPTQQWANHWRKLGVKGGLCWGWCLGSCLGIPRRTARATRTRLDELCAPDTLAKMGPCKITSGRPETEKLVSACSHFWFSVEENESDGPDVPVDVHSGFDAKRSSYCLLSSIICWFNGELPTSGAASRNESELADTQRSAEQDDG